MTSRLAQIDAHILDCKTLFDWTIQFTPRTDRETRLLLWRDFLAHIAPLVAEREALLKPTYVTPRWRQRQICAAQIDSSERRQERAHRETP